MFQIKFINPANSVNYTVFAEGYPITVERSLPTDIKSYFYEGNDLIFVVEHPDETSRLAWVHTLEYLKEQFVPERIGYVSPNTYYEEDNSTFLLRLEVDRAVANREREAMARRLGIR